jgi:hypothetical protein
MKLESALRQRCRLRQTSSAISRKNTMKAAMRNTSGWVMVWGLTPIARGRYEGNYEAWRSTGVIGPL